jgi:hypothetical protein
MPGLSRRTFLLGSAAASVVAACGGDDGEATPTTVAGTGSTSTTAASSVVLGATFDRNGLLVRGIPQRAPFVLFEPTGGLLPLDRAPAELTFEIESPGGSSLPSVAVARHGDDVDRAYYPLITTFEEAGLHAVRAEVDGQPVEYQVNVNDPAAVGVPQVGQPLPPVATPTTADPLGVAVLCTAEPPCPLHEVSLDTAIADGRPVALLVSTPAYCQVAICGPVLDVLVAAAPAHPDLAIIHLEVYPNGAPPAAPPTPVLADPLGLNFEPVLFVAGADGVLTARLDNIYDGAELGAALGSPG